jgi:transcriptional regulator with PAS, ATPase and Fis domain
MLSPWNLRVLEVRKFSDQFGYIRLPEGSSYNENRATIEGVSSMKDDMGSCVAPSGVDPFLGDSPAIRLLAGQARRVLAVQSPVLILGETGTGKSVLARWLHANGARGGFPFVELNCAGLSRSFLESELFGHEKGAFTGAIARKQGLFEIAEHGTVFLDEIGDMDPRVQPKLLKALEEKRYRRLGDVHDRQADIRLIAATHQDLGARIKGNQFRSDLYFRISTIQLRIPPLRERGEDVPALADAMLRRFGRDFDRSGVRLSPDALRALQMHSWPGNLREFINVLQRTLLFSDNDILHQEDLRFDACTQIESHAPDTHLSLQELERKHIERVLQEENGHVAEAAARLGIPRSTLYQKIKNLQLVLSET